MAKKAGSGAIMAGLSIAAVAIVSNGTGLAQAPVAEAGKNSAAPVAGANSFMESQARKLIESRGFSEVSPLVNDSQGLWTGTAKNGTATVRVSVDFKGNVTANPE